MKDSPNSESVFITGPALSCNGLVYEITLCYLI